MLKTKTTARSVAMALKVQAEKRSIIRRGTQEANLGKSAAKSVNKL